MTRPAVQRISDRECAIRTGELPADVVARATACILDQMGIQLRAASLPVVAPVLAPEYDGPATTYSEFAGAALGHSCEFDDCHFDCGHPGCCVVSAALGVGGRLGSSGDAVLRAVVAGYEAEVLAIGPVHAALMRNGWDGTKVGGVFGAAAAAASLLGSDAEGVANALAIAASDACGTTEFASSGGDVKLLHPASATRAGVTAAVLAHRGMAGPRRALEGERGLYALFAGGDDNASERIWSGEYHLRDVIFRLYPLVARHHAALDAAARLVADHGVHGQDVAEVVVGLPRWAMGHADPAGPPKDAVGAQASLRFSMALLLTEGHNKLSAYLDPARWSDATLGALAERVTAVGRDFGDPDARLGAEVELVLRDGRRLTRFEPTFRGNADNPATADEIERKYFDLAGEVVDERTARAVADAVTGLPSASDLGGLLPLLRQAAQS